MACFVCNTMIKITLIIILSNNLAPFQLIFANIKHLNDKGHNVERITLEQFRDEVVLCTDIEIVINEVVKSGEFEIPRSVIQMLLILGKLFPRNVYFTLFNLILPNM